MGATDIIDRSTIPTDDLGALAAYRDNPGRQYMSITDAIAISRELARAIDNKMGLPDMVVGIANGALLPTKVVGDYLGRPYEIVRVRRRGSGFKQRLVRLKQRLRIPSGLVTVGPMAVVLRTFEHYTSKMWPQELEARDDTLGFDVRDRHVLLIDDCIETGASIQFVLRQLLAGGAAKVSVGAICLYGETKLPADQPGYPDVFLHRTIHFYPWCVANAEYDDYLRWLDLNQLKLWE
jgi:hypoxanthine phosphoribosyltransferase